MTTRVNIWRNSKIDTTHCRPPVIKTVEEYNDLAYRIRRNDKSWFGDFSKLVNHYYLNEGCACGGLLHIVLDDGNITKESISWCAGLCCGLQDEEGGDIANLMSLMTWKQRKRVYLFALN